MRKIGKKPRSVEKARRAGTGPGHSSRRSRLETDKEPFKRRVSNLLKTIRTSEKSSLRIAAEATLSEMIHVQENELRKKETLS